VKDLAINLHEFLPFIIFFVVFPLVFYLSYRSQKKQKEAFKAIGLKLGLQFVESPAYQQLQKQMQSNPSYAAKYGQLSRRPGSGSSGGPGLLKLVLSAMTPPGLAGKYNGSEVRINLVKKDKQTRTEFKAFFSAPLDLGLKINPNSILFRNLSFGSKEQSISTGNQAFDRKIMVKGRDPLKVKYLLTFEVQRTLVELFSSHPGTSIDDSGITISVNGFMYQTDEYKIILNRLTAVAQNFKS
jgi:hypothetical protein